MPPAPQPTRRPRPASAPPPGERLEPPPGVPARLWLDLLADHPGLVERLRTVEEDGEAALADALAELINQRLAAAAGDPADAGEDAEAARIELLFQRYAAVVAAGDAGQRRAFEREHADLMELVADGEGRAIFAEVLAEERALRRRLPTL